MCAFSFSARWYPLHDEQHPAKILHTANSRQIKFMNKILSNKMKKVGKRGLLLLIPIILIMLYFGFPSSDNAEKIVHKLLFDSNSKLDDKTFSAAMNARFSTGTDINNLTDFVKVFNGQCSAVGDDKFSCTLNLSGSFCVANNLRLDVKIGLDRKIESVNATRFSISC